MKKRLIIFVTILAFLLGSISPFMYPASAADQVESTMTLATTTSTQDSGLLDYLLPTFEKDYDTKVKVVAVGSGQAMEMGKKGDADVLLVHSRKAEDQFVAEGWGINRKDVMHNQFLVVGPASDPAKIKDLSSIAAFKKIAEDKAKFISRADKSGTHTKELGIWTKADIKPAAPWYVESGQGMGDTLMMASEMKAYTLTDDATFLAMRSKLDLVELVGGDKNLANPYGVIAVNPAKYPTVHQNAANAFINFITGPKGQGMIASFGKEKFGRPLFTTDAIPAAQLQGKTAPTTVNNVAAPAANIQTATVKVRAANIRSGAGTNYKILGSVKKGATLEILSKKGSWYQVKYGNGTGYIAGWLVTVK